MSVVQLGVGGLLVAPVVKYVSKPRNVVYVKGVYENYVFTYRFSAPDDLTGFSVFLKMDRGMCRISDILNGGMIAL
mgnify:CR=1 FL=1